MAEGVLWFVLRALAYMLFNGLLFVTAKIVLPLFTFGRWRVKPLNDFKSPMAWYGFKRQPDGTMLVGFEPAILVGLLLRYFPGRRIDVTGWPGRQPDLGDFRGYQPLTLAQRSTTAVPRITW